MAFFLKICFNIFTRQSYPRSIHNVGVRLGVWVCTACSCPSNGHGFGRRHMIKKKNCTCDYVEGGTNQRNIKQPPPTNTIGHTALNPLAIRPPQTRTPASLHLIHH